MSTKLCCLISPGNDKNLKGGFGEQRTHKRRKLGFIKSLRLNKLSLQISSYAAMQFALHTPPITGSTGIFKINQNDPKGERNIICIC